MPDLSLACTDSLVFSNECILAWTLTKVDSTDLGELERMSPSAGTHLSRSYPIEVSLLYSKIDIGVSSSFIFSLSLWECSALGKETLARWRAMLWIQKFHSAIRRHESRDRSCDYTQVPSQVHQAFSQFYTWCLSRGAAEQWDDETIDNLDVLLKVGFKRRGEEFQRTSVTSLKLRQIYPDLPSLGSLPGLDLGPVRISSSRSSWSSSVSSVERGATCQSLAPAHPVAVSPRHRLLEAWSEAGAIKQAYRQDSSPMTKPDLIALNRPLCHRVSKGLYISGSIFAGDLISGYSYGITSYMRLGTDYPFQSELFRDRRMRFCEIPLRDQPSEGASLRSLLPYLVSYLVDEIARGHRVLVFCNEGVSRSATVISAYLIVKHVMSWHDAIRRLSRIRSCISPNLGFMHELKRFSRLIGELPSVFKLSLLQNTNAVVLCQLDKEEPLSRLHPYLLVTSTSKSEVFLICDKGVNIQPDRLQKLVDAALEDLAWVAETLYGRIDHPLLTIKARLREQKTSVWPVTTLDETNLQEVLDRVAGQHLIWTDVDTNAKDEILPNLTRGALSGIRWFELNQQATLLASNAYRESHQPVGLAANRESIELKL
eukprot:GHVH01005554.1.p1 GENE.GHVH01005554.1~~GHVH01005554.1.p1  ORF type:complete len:599 (+),score=64.71 GHVH01005554.1:801-2597(+)